MKRLWCRLMVAVGLSWAAAVTAAQAAEPVRIAGTGSGIALIGLLFEAFKATHPQWDLVMSDSVGSSGAIRGLAAGKLDVGVLLRPLKPDEVPGGRAAELCRTPFVFFATPAHAALALTRKDLRTLYDGTMAAEFRPLLRPEQDSASIALLGHFPELAEPVATARQIRGRVVALTDQDAMEAVEHSSSLIGAGAYAPLLAEQRSVAVLPLDGVRPGIQTLASGRYPFAMTLYLAVGASPSPGAAALLGFLSTPAAAAVMRDNGCLPPGQ